MRGSAVDALPHGFDQRIQRDWFPQDALHVQPFEVLAGAGHDDDRNVSRRGARRNVLLNDEAVDHWQAQVEHDCIRRIAIDSLKGVESVASFVHFESRKPERRPEHVSEGVIIFHDEDGSAERHRGMIRD